MAIGIKDADGATQQFATGSGDGSATPYKSPAAVSIGATDDAAAGTDTATSSLIGLAKRLLQRLTALLPAALTSGGGMKVGVVDALPAGTNIVGNVRIDQTTPGTTNGVRASNFPNTLDTNTGNANRYVKLYNKASAPSSSDTPVKRLFVPAGGGVTVPASQGIAFDTGIAFRITTGVADNDANAATANDVLVNADYK